jgi:GR25 family glycosyltransferase involved in LPS biosynthesis
MKTDRQASDRQNLFKTYVISLNQPTKLLNKLHKCHLNPTLFMGTNGQTINNNVIQKYTTPFYSMFGPKSAIGCAISHISVWKDFLKSNEKYAIIFEDDVIFNSNKFKEKILSYLSHTPENFDILYLGCFGSNPKNTFFNLIMNILNKSCKFSQINKHIIKPKVALATHAYILSKSGANKLIHYLNGHIHNHIDLCIQGLSKQNLIHTYVTNPRIVFQTSTNNTPSQNVSNSHPILFNRILSNFYIDKFVKANYITTLSIFRLHNYNITLSNILLFIFCLLLFFIKTPILFIIYFIIIISLPDFIQ